MRSELVTEREDGWLVLPLVGMRAEEMLESLWLVVRDGADEARVGVPDDLAELGRSVVADRAAVVEAVVSPEGRLELTFAGDRVLSVSPLEDAEAWELRGPGEVNVICLPGGGEPAVAVWDAGTPTYRMRAGDSLPDDT